MKVPVKLTTLIAKVQKLLIEENADLINQFPNFMKNNNSSERLIINNIKVILNFHNFF